MAQPTKKTRVQRDSSANGVFLKSHTRSDKRVVMRQVSYYCVVMTTVSEEYYTNESHNKANCVSPRSLTYHSQGTQAHWPDRPDKTSVEHNETYQEMSEFSRKIKIHYSSTFIQIFKLI